MSDFQMKSLKGQEMMSFLPAYYETSRVMKSGMDAAGTELDLLYLSLNDTLKQFFVRTATWGLDRWEQELGIQTELLKPFEQRRAVVQSKLRGAGQFTGSLVKNVAEAYHGGSVDVSFQPEVWSFTVKFVDTIGIPPNLDDLKAAIEEIKPAHLSVKFAFNYLLIQDVHNKMTLNELQATPLTKFAFNRKEEQHV